MLWMLVPPTRLLMLPMSVLLQLWRTVQLLESDSTTRTSRVTPNFDLSAYTFSISQKRRVPWTKLELSGTNWQPYKSMQITTTFGSGIICGRCSSSHQPVPKTTEALRLRLAVALIE